LLLLVLASLVRKRWRTASTQSQRKAWTRFSRTTLQKTRFTRWDRLTPI